MRIANYLIGALAASSILLIAPTAAGAPFTYEFTVTATSGPLTGASSTGFFSYDSSGLTPNVFIFETGLLTALNFTWDGVTYNATTANDAFIAVDSTGALSSIMFGDNCTSSGCNVTGPGQWSVVLNISDFAYQPSVGVEGFGTVTYAQVPEPATFTLLALGGSCLAAVVARRARFTGELSGR